MRITGTTGLEIELILYKLTLEYQFYPGLVHALKKTKNMSKRT